MKRILSLVTVALILASSVFAQKKNLSREDYDQWQSIRSYKLSNDGKWAFYTISPGEGNDTLYVLATESDKEYKLGLCSMASFSEDSKWLAVRKGYSKDEEEKMKENKKPVHYKTVLVELESGKKKIFHDISSFSFTKDSKHLVMNDYSAEKEKEKNLFLYKLGNGTTKTIGNVIAQSVNKGGNLLAYIISTSAKTGNSVELFNLNNYSTMVIDNDSCDYSNLSWEKEGKAFTFLKSLSDTGYVEDNHRVFVVKIADAKPEIIHFNPLECKDIPDNMRVRETYRPRLSKNLDIVYFGVYKWTEKENKKDDKGKKKANDEKLPGVDIWHWKDDPIQPRQKIEYDRSDKNFTYLFAWDLEDNSIVRISDDEFEDPYITASGDYVTVKVQKEYEPQFRERYFDHYLINPATGEKKPILEKFTNLYGSSPGGNYMVYFKDKNWWLYDIKANSHSNISSGINVELWNTRDDRPGDVKPPFGMGGWYEDDSYIMLYDEYDIWKVNALTAEAELITNGREEEIRFRTIRLDFEDNFFKAQEDLFVSATGDKTKFSGFYRITPNGKRVQLIYEDMFISGLSKAKSRDKFIYRAEKYNDSPDLFVSNSLFRKKEQISSTNPQQEDYFWGRSELVNYTNTDGKALQGALYYPANYEEGKKYPMIVYIYEIRSTGLHRYVNPSNKSAYNTTNYTTEGYFVFQPDIVYKTNHPGESAVDCVVPAVEEVIKTGMIDKDKIGLMGHSWGAYQTAFIITRTDLFSAAIAGAPLINMISMYNEIYWNSGSPNQNIFETSQGRLREPWWEIMQEYMDNSPMFNADNITTPLLVTFGNKDGAVDWHQGIEMFTTMRRMEKPYIMLVYDGENHGLRKEENMKDYSIKVNEFLKHHLLGEEPKAWIKEGKSYLNKLEEQEKHNRK